MFPAFIDAPLVKRSRRQESQPSGTRRAGPNQTASNAVRQDTWTTERPPNSEGRTACSALQNPGLSPRRFSAAASGSIWQKAAQIADEHTLWANLDRVSASSALKQKLYERFLEIAGTSLVADAIALYLEKYIGECAPDLLFDESGCINVFGEVLLDAMVPYDRDVLHAAKASWQALCRRAEDCGIRSPIQGRR